MRRLPDGFRYTMEFLIASACLAFKEEGAAFVSLSGVPLATARSSGADDGDRGVLDALPRHPRHPPRALLRLPVPAGVQVEVPALARPLYLVFPDEAALPRIGLALTRAYLPEAGMRDLVSLARQPRRPVRA